MFRCIRFLYAIIVMVMIYLRINLKLKLLFYPTLYILKVVAIIIPPRSGRFREENRP
jgi:hypothetical protein